MNKKSSECGARRLKKAKNPNMGMSKHRKSGHTPGPDHFTGRKAGKKIRRKGRRGKMTRKMRRAKRGKHVNKYRDENKKR